MSALALGAHGDAAVPLGFQPEIIDTLARELDAGDHPLLLKAPTASGKTFMLGRAVQATVRRVPALWFWFAPYTSLVSQTIASLREHCRELHPLDLATERRSDHRAGDVLVSSAQRVAATTKDARRIYVQDDAGLPSLQVVVNRARMAGLKIGLVIDEAHIGAADHTVFGKFCRELRPDRIMMASATPKDRKLTEFVGAAGWPPHLVVSVSRASVVQAGLNKTHVEACVYELDRRWSSAADLKRTALRRAWGKHCELRDALRTAGVGTVPLLLVQVENGKTATREAMEYLVHDCEVPHDMIAEHTADSPNPLALTRIATDPTRQVLIFKEAAGTGFDAPRAFVLASMKAVVDADYATQFLGRIMRVDRRVRALFTSADVREQHAVLDTGYLFLANAAAQDGYQKAVDLSTLFGHDGRGRQFAEVTTRHTSDGAVMYSSRPTPQAALPLRVGDDPRADDGAPGLLGDDGGAEATPHVGGDRGGGGSGAALQPDLFAAATRAGRGGGSIADGMRARSAGAVRRGALAGPHRDAAAVAAAATAAGLRVYPQRPALPHFGGALRTERPPALTELGLLARDMAGLLEYTPDELREAMILALHGVEGVEKHTRLNAADRRWDVDVSADFDRALVARDARGVLDRALHMEESDQLTFLKALVQRLGPDLVPFLHVMPRPSRPSDERLRVLERDVTHVLVRGDRGALAAAHQRALAKRVRAVPAAPLPDALVVPSILPLEPSARNVYGVLPPLDDDLRNAELAGAFNVGQPFQAGRATAVPLTASGAECHLVLCDATWAMNESETVFARRLDDAGFVLWWHRNPQGKPYSTGVIRADRPRPFYPDFVVCLTEYEGAEPRHRLIETKHDGVDAALKARRVPPAYGRVAFIRRGDKDRNGNDQFHLLTEQGALGEPIDAKLRTLRELFRQSPPDEVLA